MDDTATVNSIVVHFGLLADPRREHRRRHHLLDILTIAICAVICNADTWEDVELWGQANEKWLKTFLELPGGIPSHDTFNRVFRLLDPQSLQDCLVNWMAALHVENGLKIIAIDGKSLRGSFDKASCKSALHLVSAWATENSISLGQVAVADKSNEITAIPGLLKIIDVSGALVTIDAMGCQKDIAADIRVQQGDYILALKDNQPTLAAAVIDRFAQGIETNFAGLDYETFTATDKSHGRIDQRTCEVLRNVTGLPGQGDWVDLKTIVCITRISECRGQETSEVRYFISSASGSAELFARAIKDHWKIETTLHWTLDVTFREDASRLRKDHGPQNLALLRRIAVSLLKNETSIKASIKGKRLLAGWDQSYLLKILFQIPQRK